MSTARLKIKLLIQNGMTKSRATNQILDELIAENEKMDEMLGMCIDCMDPMQVANVFNDTLSMDGLRENVGL